MLKTTPKPARRISGNLLVVDDAPSILIILKSFLEDDRCRLFPAENGAKALEILEEQPIDLVLLDVMMPEMGGYEVCRKMRENPRFRDIPVIFLTGLGRKEEIVRGLDVGGSDYLIKPFDKEELILRVRQHLQAHANQKRLKRLAQEQKIFSQALNEELKRQVERWEPVQQKLAELSDSSAKYFGEEFAALQTFFHNVRQWGDLLAGNDTTMRSMLTLGQEIDWAQWDNLLAVKGTRLTLTADAGAEIFADVRMVNLMMGQILPWLVELTEPGAEITVGATKAEDAMQLEINWQAPADRLDAVPDLLDLSQKSTSGDAADMPLRLSTNIMKRHFGDVSLVREAPDKARLSFFFPNT
ncbi:response regulator [Cerasicoccus fimbriatus]|uniref:response regulator n=1 Tax=Cerasicoccus fimbriatus TaxID=3014554 RepID=UPI0022B51BB0|nr:response regulator [Cerasicoccus sp. TK19100]